MMAAVVVALATVASAQPVFTPSAGSVTRAGQPSTNAPHGWVIVPEPHGSGWLLIHLPPRQRVGADGRLHGSPPGTARVAIRLDEQPEALAAVGDDVYLVYPPIASPTGELRRRVYSMTAVAAGLADLWAYVPDRRLQVEPSLSGDGELKGLVATPVGPAALIDRGPHDQGSGFEPSESGVSSEVGRTLPRPPPDLSLSVLAGGQWRAIALPAGLLDPASPVDAGSEGSAAERVRRRFMLASCESGLVLLATRPARRATRWTAPLTPQLVRWPETERRRQEAAQIAADASPVGESAATTPPPPLDPVQLDWTAAAIAMPLAPDRSAVLPTGPLSAIGAGVVFVHAEPDGGLGVYWAGGLAERVAGLAGAEIGIPGAEASREAVAGVVGWVEAHRVVIVLAPEAASVARSRSLLDSALTLRVIELSTDTGAVMFDGASTTGSPIDKEELQALLLVVLGVTTILLLWTVRGSKRERVIQLPEGSALGEPTRRLLAGAVDFLATCCVSGWILGVPLIQTLSLQVVLGPDAPPGGLITVLGVGIGLGTLAEGVFGRSLGKLAMGLRVVAVLGPRGGTWRGPGIGRALARNVFKWAAAPVAIFGMSRPDGRHWGDVVTGSAVVVRVENEAEPEG